MITDFESGLFLFANLVQYSEFDSDEAAVTGKLINLRYHVLHLLSNCFILSTYFCRDELLKFKMCTNVLRRF